MKMVGAILKPLFQCDYRMIEAGRFTKEQFQAGMEAFLDHMAHFFECNIESVVVEYYGTMQRSNKWSNIKDNRYEGSQTELVHK